MKAFFEFLFNMTGVTLACLGLLYAALLTGVFKIFAWVAIFLVPVFICNMIVHAVIASNNSQYRRHESAMRKVVPFY